MNPDPDYSAAYAVLRTDAADLAGHALCFTIGRGNEVMVNAISRAERGRGRPAGRTTSSPTSGLSAPGMVGDSHLRWLGPEKGVMHMAIGAVVNAAWDLAAKVAGKPVWRLLADLTPEQIVDLVDFRYLEDALTPTEALEILRAAAGRTRAADRGARALGLPRVHHHARLDRVLRREASPARPGRPSPTGSPRSS